MDLREGKGFENYYFEVILKLLLIDQMHSSPFLKLFNKGKVI
jgi:hypothetical protein